MIIKARMKAINTHLAAGRAECICLFRRLFSDGTSLGSVLLRTRNLAQNATFAVPSRVRRFSHFCQLTRATAGLKMRKRVPGLSCSTSRARVLITASSTAKHMTVTYRLIFPCIRVLVSTVDRVWVVGLRLPSRLRRLPTSGMRHGIRGRAIWRRMIVTACGGCRTR